MGVALRDGTRRRAGCAYRLPYGARCRAASRVAHAGRIAGGGCAGDDDLACRIQPLHFACRLPRAAVVAGRMAFLGALAGDRRRATLSERPLSRPEPVYVYSGATIAGRLCHPGRCGTIATRYRATESAGRWRS